MSYHVYIARAGFKNTPIPHGAWLAAARERPELVVEEQKNRFGKIHHSVNLKGDKRAWLSLTPYGLIHAQDPPRELVSVMFDIARVLDAGVYSERLKPYKSVDDWERRTRKYRESRDERRAQYRKGRRVRIAFWILFLVAAAALGWLAGGR